MSNSVDALEVPLLHPHSGEHHSRPLCSWRGKGRDGGVARREGGGQGEVRAPVLGSLPHRPEVKIIIKCILSNL